MRRTTRIWSIFVLVLFVPSVRAQVKPSKVVREYWDAAYLEGVKAGYFHTLVVETERDGKKLFVTTQTMSLKVKRDGKVVELKMDNGVEETADGKVAGVAVTMYTGDKALTVTGRVEGDKLVMRGDDNRELKRLPWDATALGLYAQDRVWKEKKVKPGDRFDFTNYELSIEKAFKVNVAVKDAEETDLLEVKKDDLKGKAERVKRSLLRTEALPDKVDVGGALLQLPKVVSWLDGDWNVVRSETRMPGLGRIITFRTTKAAAMEEGTAPELLPDLLLTTLIPLNKPIDRPFERTEVVYHITMTDDDAPATAFMRDFRQSVENANDKTFNLRVRAQRNYSIIDAPQKVSDEHRTANHFLNSDDATVMALTKRAIGTETDAWGKAQRIEKWVHENMRGTSDVVFATASQIARPQGRLPATRHADSGDVPGRRAAVADCARPGLHRGPRQGAGAGVPHVDGGVYPRPVDVAGRDARPGRHRPDAPESQRSQLAQHADDGSAPVGAARARQDQGRSGSGEITFSRERSASAEVKRSQKLAAKRGTRVMPRIVSLIASATEIVCALGFEDHLVARSHECDFPESVKRLPIVTRPKFDPDGTSYEIDQRVKAIVQESLSVYRVDGEKLQNLEADVIVTQAHCEVCAVSLREVERTVCTWLRRCPKLISLSPNALADIWDDIELVAVELGEPERGREVVGRLRQRVNAISDTANRLPSRPTVACIEWLDPLMAAGNWMPELVGLAGGINLFGAAGKHSPWMTWEQLTAADPDVIVLLPCGFDMARTRRDLSVLTGHPEWPRLQAVSSGRAFVADGNQFFNRPGPRLVESLEILAELLHPETFVFGHEGIGWQRV